MPTYVEYGVADCGIAGRDVLLETGADVLEPLDLGFGRCRVVVAGPAGRGFAPDSASTHPRREQVREACGGALPGPGARRRGGEARRLRRDRARAGARRLHRGRGRDGPHAGRERARGDRDRGRVLGAPDREPRELSTPGARRCRVSSTRCGRPRAVRTAAVRTAAPTAARPGGAGSRGCRARAGRGPTCGARGRASWCVPCASGDAALVRFTARFDGVAAHAAPAAGDAGRDPRARRSAPTRRVVAALARDGAADRGLPPAPARPRLPHAARPTARCSRRRVRPLASVGLYVPGGPRRLPVLGAHGTRSPRAWPAWRGSWSSRRRARSRGTRRWRRRSLVAGVERARLPRRRRAGDRGARVRHADDPARRQDRRARQRLRGGRQARGARAGRDRHRGRAERGRDPGRRRRGRRAAWRPTSWRRPSTAAATRRSCS